MRIFIAVEFNENIKKYLQKIQSFVQQRSIRGNFTLFDNFHLTIKFIGEVKPMMLPEIYHAMEDAVAGVSEFTLYTGKLGSFSRGEKKIIWLGLQGNLDSLFKLNRQVEAEMIKRGFPRGDVKFLPHITLGREVVLQEQLESLDHSIPYIDNEIVVNRITLMESKRQDGRLVYAPIHSQAFI